MSIPEESQPQELNAPSAILDHMRRRIGGVGVLVGVLSASLASLALFVFCFWTRLD